MASPFLTMTSSMSCPHGGIVTPSTSNTRVKADRQFVLRSTDTFTIGGCSYTIGNVPHPCVSVRWDVHAERHTSQGDPSLTEDSVGLCLAGDGGTQGTVVITSTQSRASGS
ncbi:MAG: hypothetical protein IPK78_19975 [Rhodospirillales bacterium]|nr:hypothetical protein [Rhodospirillales bacterium]